MRIYIAGPISGHLNYRKKFNAAEKLLQEAGHVVINPAFLPCGLGDNEDYMHICYAMIDKCDAVFMLYDWRYSKGAKCEHEYAKKENKQVFYQEE